MNSSSKILIAFFMLWPCQSWALQVQALYTSPCQREIGIILHTDKRYVYLLNLEGKFRKVGRYQIQNLSSYSLDHLPVSGSHVLPDIVPHYRFWNEADKGDIKLAEGIVIGSTQTGFQLLDFQGRDAHVSFESIWKIEKVEEGKKLELPARSVKYNFAHPAKGICAGEEAHGPDTIFISEMLTDPVAMKRHLDRQIIAREKVERQREAQVFYPVPQVYKNRTQIGYWLPLGNRYGSARGRSSGFAPLIRNEFSAGPFAFQHLSLTGAGPIPGSIHEEPQTMLYYSFKASYISFAGFLDPSLILTGSQYQWEEDDMRNGDNRIVESSHVALGFDRGHWSMKLFLLSHMFGGHRYNNGFTRYDGDMSRIQLSWQGRALFAALSTNMSSKLKSKKDDGIPWEEGEMQFVRADAEWRLSSPLKLEFWFIRRDIDFDSETGETYGNNSQTIGTGLEWGLGKRTSVAARVSREAVDSKDDGRSKSRNYMKFASGVYLDF